MRSSDWSSDVCSSDLCPRFEQVDTRRHAQNLSSCGVKLGTFAKSGGLWVVPGSTSPTAPPHCRVGAVGHSPGVSSPDRTSVVLGQSVLVRVDLGGRSILKQTNNS